MKLVLASASPQRRDILASLGADFDIRPTNVQEDDAGPPAVVAQENALRKALACPRGDDEIVLAVDTLVATELEIWGKPPNRDAAANSGSR